MSYTIGIDFTKEAKAVCLAENINGVFNILYLGVIEKDGVAQLDEYRKLKAQKHKDNG